MKNQASDIRISQSLMKSLHDYRFGDECGMVFKAKFLDKAFDVFYPSKTQLVGTWFEYICTGSLPKDGKVPEPERMKTGELTAPYRLMEKHIANYKHLINYYDIEVLETSKVLKFGAFEGVVDIWARARKDIYGFDESGVKRVSVKAGQEFIIDMKTTGLLDDKWNDYGWELGNLANKFRLTLQPIHYKMIMKETTGYEPPFLFFLFNTTDEKDFRIIDFRCQETDFNEHKGFIENTIAWLGYYMKTGFKAKPTTAKCAYCWLNNEYRAEVNEELSLRDSITVHLLSGEQVIFTRNKKLGVFVGEHNEIDFKITSAKYGNKSIRIKPIKIPKKGSEPVFPQIHRVETKFNSIPLLPKDCEFKAKISPIQIFYYSK